MGRSTLFNQPTNRPTDMSVAVNCALRFAGKLHVTSVMNDERKKHLRVERALTADEQQQLNQDKLHARCVRIDPLRSVMTHWQVSDHL